MDLSYSSIGLSLIIVLMTLGIVYFLKLGMVREISIASVRIFLQLLIMGYVLSAILQTEHLLVVFLVLIGMALFGAYTAGRREKTIDGTFYIALVSILSGILGTLGIILVFGVVELKAQHVIPIASMIIGNGMNTISLMTDRLKAEMQKHKQQIEAALCLGASSRQAAEMPLRAAIKASLIPSVNRATTVGIVTLPGSMSGMIFAGIDPLSAVKYQMLIEYVLIGSVAITVMCSALLTYKRLFTKHHQLKNDLL
jgi:putative ABC transport system permease protein